MPYSPGTTADVKDNSNGRVWNAVVESNDGSTIVVFLLRFRNKLRFDAQSLATNKGRFELIRSHYR